MFQLKFTIVYNSLSVFAFFCLHDCSVAIMLPLSYHAESTWTCTIIKGLRPLPPTPVPLWKTAPSERVTSDTGTRYCVLDPKAMQQAARKRADGGGDTTVENLVESRVTAGAPSAPVNAVRTWIAGLQQEPCNAEQRSFCERVGSRVEAELLASTCHTDCREALSEPLRWVLHGGPGTGKSYVLKFLRRELFENVLQWQHGVDFQIVSFQAVMAELLDGDTIHHALGLDWSGDRTQSLARAMECAGRSLQWRWLILDEFSMVSAELLAQLELRCRELMRDLSLAKYDRKGRSRPFGGLNVILAGDVYQLPPPKGTFLGDIPWDLLAGRKSTRRAPGHQGQTLLWGSAEAGMQGVTELVRCERTQDAWLAELQTQFRHGQLSEDNHNFLHGKPTAVPGSWIAGHATCKQPGCAALVANGKTPDCIQAAECSQCAADRRSRILVAQGPTDKRFQAEFADAVAIFGTNDIKVSREQASCPTVGQSQRQTALLICSTRCGIGTGRPREGKPDVREIRLAAAARQRMRRSLRCVAVMRRHARARNGSPRPETRYFEGHEGPRGGLV